jgi:EAL domain-containing protein (putative c-di-GMP-specific phosphodiesterase class I)
MYTAKRQGKGRIAVFEPAMQAEVLERLRLEADLRRVLDRRELFLEYQPIVDLTTGELMGLEALVRWQHPSRGRVGPGEFIALAEETGLIMPIGRWVLATACQAAATWQRAYPSDPPFLVSVNVSPRQIEQGALVEQVADALRESGLDPQCLTLEITEGSLMRRSESTLALLHALKALGVQLAIDDFGTGYSSLSYLQDLPIDVLKIDKSFVDHVAEPSGEPPVARAIVQLGRTLGLRTVAEGIETPQQARRLRELACDLGQGYYFDRPLSHQQVDDLLRERRSVNAPAASTDDDEGDTTGRRVAVA